MFAIAVLFPKRVRSSRVAWLVMLCALGYFHALRMQAKVFHAKRQRIIADSTVCAQAEDQAACAKLRGMAGGYVRASLCGFKWFAHD